ncbi:MAG TPA: hypothetical protein VGX78_19935 [Pirellulales bacterium]|jgi:hypothetical protein|nr:hypothetical protein [Pirellulales bacterium]
MFAPIRRYIALLADDAVAEHAQQARDAQRENQSRQRQHAAYRQRAQEVVERWRRLAVSLTAQRDAAINDAGELKQDLAAARVELDKTAHALAVAEEENRRLWALAQRDQARVERERAMHDRRRAEFENPPAAE